MKTTKDGVRLSNHGVCYELERSPYTYTYMDWVFHFSSIYHKDKFVRGLTKKVLWLNDSMSNRFHVQVEFAELAAIQWYQQCETRGFYIKDAYSGRCYRWPHEFRYAGQAIR